MRHHRNAPTYISAIAIALVASGCHVNRPYEPTPPAESASALETLKSLPSLEDTQTQLQSAIDQIASTASAIAPGITWKTADNEDSGGCQHPYEQSPGVSRFLPNRIGVNALVSEQQWAAIQDAAKAAAATVQATEIQAMQDSPGNHDVGFYGPAGLFLKVSYGGNLVIAGYTGCRLPRARA